MTEPSAQRDGFPTYDPFEQVGYPSLSFANRVEGFGYDFTVMSVPEWLQTQDEDGRPAYWESDTGERGNPKVAAVFSVHVTAIIDDEGDTIQDTAGVDDENDWMRSVWAVKPSGLYTAIRVGIKKAKAPRLEVSGTGRLLLDHFGPKPTQKNRDPQKFYTLDYTAPPTDVRADQAPF